MSPKFYASFGFTPPLFGATRHVSPMLAGIMVIIRSRLNPRRATIRFFSDAIAQ
uniref:Uncharacterized protein n=1 Tax=Magnetospirillum gryphiswaldense TaxID=55518 RepID=A4TWZ9_9PROT|nr:hypothetical protein MGR_0653 [Magnetospirillum gryphiswaldense MSR-1]